MFFVTDTGNGTLGGMNDSIGIGNNSDGYSDGDGEIWKSRMREVSQCQCQLFKTVCYVILLCHFYICGLSFKSVYIILGWVGQRIQELLSTCHYCCMD